MSRLKRMKDVCIGAISLIVILPLLVIYSLLAGLFSLMDIKRVRKWEREQDTQ